MKRPVGRAASRCISSSLVSLLAIPVQFDGLTCCQGLEEAEVSGVLAVADDNSSKARALEAAIQEALRHDPLIAQQAQSLFERVPAARRPAEPLHEPPKLSSQI
jgi:hypothetical protein